MSVGNQTLATCVCCFVAAGYLEQVQYHGELWSRRCYRDIRSQTALSTLLGALVCTGSSLTTVNASLGEM